jgi:transcription elongation factor Elf1
MSNVQKDFEQPAMAKALDVPSVTLESFTNCPRCNQLRLNLTDPVQNSLSRLDTKTQICDPCGTSESFVEIGLEVATVWADNSGRES